MCLTFVQLVERGDDAVLSTHARDRSSIRLDSRRPRYGNSWQIVEAAARSGLVLKEAGRGLFPPGYVPGGYRGGAEDEGKKISKAETAVVHVFVRQGTCAPLYPVRHEHDLSFWVPAGLDVDDEAVSVLARRARVAGPREAANVSRVPEALSVSLSSLPRCPHTLRGMLI